MVLINAFSLGHLPKNPRLKIMNVDYNATVLPLILKN